jgi:hypothetical protein
MGASAVAQRGVGRLSHRAIRLKMEFASCQGVINRIIPNGSFPEGSPGDFPWGSYAVVQFRWFSFELFAFLSFPSERMSTGLLPDKEK